MDFMSGFMGGGGGYSLSGGTADSGNDSTKSTTNNIKFGNTGSASSFPTWAIIGGFCVLGYVLIKKG